jgi:metallo-beta-lactamase class B
MGAQDDRWRDPDRDALNNEKEAAEVLEPGMRKMGLNPSEIGYILVTHAHGDHYGGAPYLVRQHRARVAMSDADWAVARVKPEVDSSSWGRVPAVDTVLKQDDALVLGDARVTAQMTPGHTVGTISPVFEVKHGGRTHKVLLWADGVQFRQGSGSARHLHRGDRSHGCAGAARRHRRAAVQPPGL